MRQLRMAAILAALTMSTACAGTKGAFTLLNGEGYRVDKPWWDPRTEKLGGHDGDESLVNLTTYCFAEDLRGNRNAIKGAPGETYECKRFAYDRARLSAIDRDRFQDVLLTASNRECDKHKARVLGTSNTVNLGLSVLGSLFSGGAAGFAAKSTKTVLAGVAAFLGSSRAQVNEQVYRQVFVGTVLAAIDDDRDAQLLQIVDKRRYPVPKDKWDPRAAGTSISGSGRIATHDETHTKESSEPEVSAAKSTAQSSDTAPKSKSVGTPPPGEKEKQNDQAAVEGEATRETPRFYGIDEAIRDADSYHQRCSFYNGLVGVAAKVEQFDPCRIVRERRERLLAELAAIEAAARPSQDPAMGPDKARYAAHLDELKSLNAKANACAANGGK